MTRRAGFTLLELALIFVLLATVCLAAAPMLSRARAVLAIRAARAEVIGALAATRAQAVLTGGAQLVITAAGDLRIERADGVLLREPLPVAARYGVTIGAGRDLPVVLRYDALGIGRMTNTTLRIHRGDIAATVIVAAYGRARS
jgi:type II secretory pathway pseudopilin PulG